MLTRKSQWMGICALVVAAGIGLNPVLASATGVGETTVFGSGYGVTDVGENEIEIDENEIWALIDRDELRSFVDVETLKSEIDKRAILESIDLDALRAQIDEEKIAIEVDNDVHPVDVINVQLPVIGKSSPFDFFIDPRNLIYSAQQGSEDGGKVEEGVSILFKNTEGDYIFSSKSDKITVTNKSNVPVRLSIEAKVTNPGGIYFVDSRSALSGDKTSIFMALGDEEGIRSVITENGEASIDVVLEPAPDGTYDFVWNEEKGVYEYSIANEDVKYDSYSFYVVGDCNKDARWNSVRGNPTISVSWKTEAAITEEEELSEEDQKIVDEIDAMVREYLGMREVLNLDEAEEAAAEASSEASAEEPLIVDEATNSNSKEETNASEASSEVTIEDEDVPGESNVAAAFESSTVEEILDGIEKEEENKEEKEENEETEEGDGDFVIRKEAVVPNVNQEEVRAGKIKNLIYRELKRLVTEEYNRIFEEKLSALVEAEVDQMEKDLFEELKEKAIKEKLEETTKKSEEIGEATETDVIKEEETKTSEDIDTTETGSEAGQYDDKKSGDSNSEESGDDSGEKIVIF